MTGGSNPRVVASCRTLAQGCGAGAILLGSLVLAGWALDVTALKSVFPGLVTVKANTALGFVLAGVSLWLLRTEGVSGRRRQVAHACAAVVALLGLLTLGEHVLGWDLGIDQLLFREGPGAAGTSAPGRTSPNAAFGFLLIGIALLLLDVETRGGGRPAQALAAATALVSLLGYAYGVPSLYGIGPYTQMAPHTAALLLVLSLGVLLARPDRGWTRAVAGGGVGGVMARRLLPAVIVVPAVLGGVRLLGERAGLYDTESGSRCSRSPTS